MKRLLVACVGVMLSAHLALAHIKIFPTESNIGAREKYTMRVPNEKQVGCSKIEGEFPPGLEVYDFSQSGTKCGESVERIRLGFVTLAAILKIAVAAEVIVRQLVRPDYEGVIGRIGTVPIGFDTIRILGRIVRLTKPVFHEYVRGVLVHGFWIGLPSGTDGGIGVNSEGSVGDLADRRAAE